MLDDGIPVSSAFPSRGRCPEGADGTGGMKESGEKRLKCVAYESNRAPTFKLRGSTGSEGSKGSKGSGGGFAANIYGAMPKGWRIEVRCLMSPSLLVSRSNPQSLIPSCLSLRGSGGGFAAC